MGALIPPTTVGYPETAEHLQGPSDAVWDATALDAVNQALELWRKGFSYDGDIAHLHAEIKARLANVRARGTGLPQTRRGH